MRTSGALLLVLLLHPGGALADDEGEVRPAVTEAQRRAAADGGAVVLEVVEAGLHRVSLAGLAEAGLGAGDADGLAVLRDGREVPAIVEGGFLHFLGRPSSYVHADNERRPRFERAGVYWVVRASGGGRAMRRRAAREGSKVHRTVLAEAWLESDESYFPMRRGDGVERWFWAMLRPGADPFRVEADLPGLAPRTDRVRVELAVVALSASEDSSSALEVLAGTRVVVRDEWRGTGQRIVRAEVPPGALASGLGLRVPVGTGVALDRVRVEYLARPEASEGRLEVRLASAGRVRAEGFGDGPLLGIDATDPGDPVWLEGLGEAGSAEVGTARREGGRIFLARADRCLAPAALRANVPSRLGEAGPADYVVLAAARFREALRPLVEAREAEGFAVLVADPRDVFDEYAAGAVHPGAIKAFLRERHARGARFVLLVGDGTADPLGEPEAAVLPVPWTGGRFLGHVASDAWYATYDDPHGRPQVALGRLPVRDPAELERVVARTLRYESGDAPGEWARRVLLVAGDEAQFQQATDELAKLLPAGRPRVHAYAGREPDAAASVRAAWDEGVGAVHYFGHGTVTGWGRRGEFLGAAALEDLSGGGRTPIVFAMNCLNASFASPGERSFAEAALLAPVERGAVAFAGSTSSCLPEPQYRLHRLLYAKALGADRPRLGEALAAALREFHDPAKAEGDGDVLSSWVLLGDPALRVR